MTAATPADYGLPYPSWYPNQLEAIEKVAASKKRFVVLELLCGGGKCLGRGTRILMYDGTIKPVESLVTGDRLMGPDSTPRTVLSTSTGHGDMYVIIPIKGKPFTVNGNHILSLLRRDTNVTDRKEKYYVVNISLIDYFKKNNYFKRTTTLYHVPIDYETPIEPLPLDSYFLGIWLGDGDNRDANVTTGDESVAKWLCSYATTLGLTPWYEKDRTGNCWNVHLVSYRRQGSYHSRHNRLIGTLRSLNLIHNKHIPLTFLTSSREERRLLLAGLIDSDGYLHNNSYEIVSKYPRLADNIQQLARSLGFRAMMSAKLVNGTTYYRVSLSGDFTQIPNCVVKRQASTRKQAKNVLVSDFKVEPVGVDNFYGFTLDKDGLFLLDDFTVTHNSGVATALINSDPSATHSAILTHTKQLQEQYVTSFPSIGKVVGRNNFRCIINESMNCAEGPCSAGWKCEYTWSCPYHQQKAAAAAKKASIHNFAYWITEANNVGVFSKLNWLILDEAHLIEPGLRKHVSINLYQPVLHDLGVRLLHDEASVEEWAEWADDNSIAVGQQVQKLQVELEKYSIDDADPNKLREIARKRRTLEELIQLSKIDDSWLSEVSHHPRYGKRFNFRPALVNTLADRYIFRHADKILLMSGTILAIGPPCTSLGINQEEVDFIQMPQTFPIENRPVYYRPSVKVRKGMPESDLQTLVSDIDKSLFRYRGLKGLMHTASYTLAKEIIKRSRYSDRLVSHTTSDRLEALEKFKLSPRDLVMTSPSMTEGIDLPEDLCRVIYFSKLPFPDLGDQQVKKRMELPDGKEWYYWTTSCTLVQASMRGLRSLTDKCTVEIFDKNWDWFKHAARKFIPKWFMAAVRNGCQETAEEALKRVLATR